MSGSALPIQDDIHDNTLALGKSYSSDSFAKPTIRPNTIVARKVLAEFMGTFMLIFTAAGSAIINEKTGGALGSFGLAAASGFAVLMIILTTGHISGAHLNPAVTFAFAATGFFPWFQVPLYIASQMLASISASFCLKAVFNPHLHGGVTVPSGTMLQSFVTEFVLTTILHFVNTAMGTDMRSARQLGGLAVGATVAMNTLVGGSISGASMNPVRSLGPAIAANNYKGLWVYFFGPIPGALLGGVAYCLIRLKDEEAVGLAPGDSFFLQGLWRTLGPTIAANNYKGLWVYIFGRIPRALLGRVAYCLIRLKDEEVVGMAPGDSFFPQGL